nr:hypothetical protein [uncultured bacterium]
MVQSRYQSSLKLMFQQWDPSIPSWCATGSRILALTMGGIWGLSASGPSLLLRIPKHLSLEFFSFPMVRKPRGFLMRSKRSDFFWRRRRIRGVSSFLWPAG